MRLWSFMQAPFSLTQKIFLQNTHQVTKKSDAARMKSILSATASQAMSLMIGTGPNANYKRSLFSNKAGLVLSRWLAPAPKTEIDSRRMETMERGNDDDAR